MFSSVVTGRKEKKMAVTHADLAPSSHRRSDLGGKTGSFLMVLSIFFGLFCFVLCLIAEATRSQMTWVGTNDEGKNDECVYNSSGKIPLLCAAGAFFALAIAMVVEHAFMLISVSNSSSSSSLLLLNLDPDSDFAKKFAWQAGFFFIATWTTFAVGEILLLIGLCVESGHLKNWGAPRPSCLILGQGLFTAAGVFGLVTVFLAAGLYITALGAERILQDQENVRQQVLETSILYASPPRSPWAAPAPAPIIRSSSALSINDNSHIQHNTTLAHYLTQFEKFSTLH